jgi:hypothetical protein
VDFKGLSGPVAFKEGDRSSLKLDVVRLGPNGWKKVGMWTTDRKLNITKPRAFWDTGVANVTLVVTCVLVRTAYKRICKRLGLGLRFTSVHVVILGNPLCEIEGRKQFDRKRSF